MTEPEPITNVESLAESPLSFSVLRSTTSHVGDRDSESRRSNIPPEDDE